jgi:hypothetical protein
VGYLTITPQRDNETLNGVRYITGTGGAHTMSGTLNDETFVGYGGSENTLIGDTMTGGGGQDTFLYRAGNVGNEVMNDFTFGDLSTNTNADVLNLADVLQGYTADNIADFVRFELLGTSDVRIRVDYNGKADVPAFTSYLQIDLLNLGLTATSQAELDALRDSMVSSGQLILA